mmetsp:Transcript_29437/g.75544  ORF Transcript_29437/g.75544 Transcript_29437/m.75544 type:complete len:227 (+) Transcript_29437:153-833(+)
MRSCFHKPDGSLFHHRQLYGRGKPRVRVLGADRESWRQGHRRDGVPHRPAAVQDAVLGTSAELRHAVECPVCRGHFRQLRGERCCDGRPFGLWAVGLWGRPGCQPQHGRGPCHLPGARGHPAVQLHHRVAAVECCGRQLPADVDGAVRRLQFSAGGGYGAPPESRRRWHIRDQTRQRQNHDRRRSLGQDRAVLRGGQERPRGTARRVDPRREDPALGALGLLHGEV